jgi:hypothetical protein
VIIIFAERKKKANITVTEGFFKQQSNQPDLRMIHFCLFLFDKLIKKSFLNWDFFVLD